MPEGVSGGGTGNQLARITIILAGVASLIASLMSFVSIWLQTKNYRKPLLQRYVVRILLMVPIYAASSWGSIMSLTAAFWLDPIRDIYEAFTIYTFFQLLINFLGGERSLIIMMHGRAPVSQPWPLNLACPKVDISDPYTFLAIKRGILQYAWLKPILSFATIIMKATNTYQEGYLGLASGYLWLGILYNVSVTLSLYSLAMFWVCTSDDLKPFRPVPKFLCIKLIIFASYWQGFFLSVLQFCGAIPGNVPGYSPDNLAAAIQDALICFEMPLFAMSHWYAFSWHDYADATISSARMPVKFAVRDAFGVGDLIQDSKETFQGNSYDYRIFDSGDNILAHEESGSRTARMMDGMRYERGGKGKYWIPKPQVNSRTPLLSTSGPMTGDFPSPSNRDAHSYRATEPDIEIGMDAEDERLFTSARALEFGDWNYPVITAHEATRASWMNQDPGLLTTSTNRNIIQPTEDYHQRRESHIQKDIRRGVRARRSSSQECDTAIASKLAVGAHDASSPTADQSQIVDLVVEDDDAEEAEKVRARKEGGAAWNREDQKRFVRTYGAGTTGKEIKTGFEPTRIPAGDPAEQAISEDVDDTAAAEQSAASTTFLPSDNPWNSPSRH